MRGGMEGKGWEWGTDLACKMKKDNLKKENNEEIWGAFIQLGVLYGN